MSEQRGFSVPALVLAGALAFAWGYNEGFVRAHRTVLEECTKLGGFYVGETVITCQTGQTRQTE